MIVNLKSGSVFLDGDQQLYSRLNQIYDRWGSHGRPLASDFQLEFVPVGGQQITRDTISSAWVIQRKFFSQIATLHKTDW